MSHQKEPGGQSRKERGRGGGWRFSSPRPGSDGPPAPATGCRLTLLLVHQDSAVGPRGAVTLHGVAVVAVIVLVPEGAVLHHLLRCTHRRSVGHPTPCPSAPGPSELSPGDSGAHPAYDKAGGASLGKKAQGWGPALPRSMKGCKSGPSPPHPEHRPGAGLLEHSSGLEESRLCGPVGPFCTPAVFMSLPSYLSPAQD